MTAELTGLEEVKNKFGDLGKRVAKKAAKAGVNAGLTPLLGAIRRQVNGYPISPELKAAVRKTLGKRLLKKEGQELTGKAGFGVGKQSEGKRRKAQDRAGDDAKRGVGISASNIHWFVLGTQDRYTRQPIKAPLPNAQIMRGLKGQRRAEAKTAVEAAGSSIFTIQYTGSILAVLAGMVEAGMLESRQGILDSMAAKIEQVIADEAAKKR